MKQTEPTGGLGEMTYRQPKISLIDIPMLLIGIAIAAPFILMLVAPFTQGI
jgi:hypothetical protein